MSLTAWLTGALTSALPSLVLVWPWNCGSATFTLTTAVNPSRKSSPLMSNLSLSNMPLPSAYFFNVLVNPRRNPVKWVPPSWVLMLLT